MPVEILVVAGERRRRKDANAKRQPEITGIHEAAASFDWTTPRNPMIGCRRIACAVGAPESRWRWSANEASPVARMLDLPVSFETASKLRSSTLSWTRYGNLAPHKTRYKTTSPGRKLLNLKGEWVATREGQLTAIPSVRAESFGSCLCKKKMVFFLAGRDLSD